MRGRSLEAKHRSVRLPVKSTAAGPGQREPLETPIPAAAHPCYIPCADPDCSLQGQHCLHFCYRGWDMNCLKDLPETLAIKGPLSCVLVTTLVEKNTGVLCTKTLLLCGLPARYSPQPCRAEKFSALAKQPELQRNNPKEEKEFVLNTGLISVLLRLSSPATWQAHRERSHLQVVGKQVPHSLGSKQKPSYFHSQGKLFSW